MMILWKATILGTTLLAMAGLAAGARGQDGAKVADQAEPARPPTPSERLKAIKAEWEAARKNCFAEMAKGKNKAEQNELFGKFYPNELDYYQRCLDLADSDPKDPGARDALLWVISDGMRNNDAKGDRAISIGKAVEGLLAHHADDPKVARRAMNIDNTPSQNRANLTRGLYGKATSHETKGIAALALANYLRLETTFVRWAHTVPEQPKARHQTYDDEGKPKVIEGEKNFDDAYWERIKHDDEAAMRREFEDLYQLVIAEYGDVAYNPWHYQGDKLVKNPRPKSLADVAQAKLDDLYNLAVGKPAPGIEGVDLDGRPLRLSDYKGKIVAVVFWNSGCGPCLAAVPHERDLLAKLKDKPFAILGVNTDEKPEAALKAIQDTKMTWPSWRDGHEGPIAERYHIVRYPTTYVIDAEGIIRHKKADGGGLDKLVDDLLAEMEPKSAEVK